MTNPHGNEEMEDYYDPSIKSLDAKVPWWLKWTYIILPIWGIITFYYFWNGSVGWFDRGHWHELQKAANTTYPYKTFAEIEKTEKVEIKDVPKK